MYIIKQVIEKYIYYDKKNPNLNLSYPSKINAFLLASNFEIIISI